MPRAFSLQSSDNSYDLFQHEEYNWIESDSAVRALILISVISFIIGSHIGGRWQLQNRCRTRSGHRRAFHFRRVFKLSACRPTVGETRSRPTRFRRAHNPAFRTRGLLESARMGRSVFIEIGRASW